MGYWEPLARIVEWPREDGNDVRDIRAASNRRRRLRVGVRLRLRKPKARRFSSDATSVGHAQRGTARPASGNPQPTPPPSPPLEQARGSWSPPLSACQKCGERVSEHLLDAAVLTAIKGSVDHRQADSLRRMWWAEAHRWALDRPAVSPDDEALVHNTLHPWRRMDRRSRRRPRSLEMATRSLFSSRGVAWVRRAPCKSQMTSGHSGRIPTSRERAKQPRQRQNHRVRRSRRCCAGYMLMDLSTNPSCHRMPGRL